MRSLTGAMVGSWRRLDKGSRGHHEPQTFETVHVYHGINFEKLFHRDVEPEYDGVFFKIMEAFDGLSEENLKDRTQEVVTEVEKAHAAYVERVKNEVEPGQRIEMWAFWDFYVLTVNCVPYRHIGQRLLSDVVLELERIGKWKDLPELGQTLRESFNDPTDDDITGNEMYTLEQWLNFNLWLARLIGSGLKRGMNLVLWSVAFGLEEDLEQLQVDLARVREERKQMIEKNLKTKKEKRAEREQIWREDHGLEGGPSSSVANEPRKEDEVPGMQPMDRSKGLDEASAKIGDDTAVGSKTLCPEAVTRITVAAEFFIQAAPTMLQESLLWHTRGPFDDSTQRVFRAGPLFAGTFGFNLERWGFWKRRLGGLRSHLGDEEAEKNVDEALGKMSAVEVAVAGHL
ncbi:hypothetical protein CKAH01_05687 [Colletotrichum kahawae]|uniref:Uncharacterized protein n=1 Tax=Colletotrichum kahawae TaxID=34407 RepID=A0AAD9YBC2_COLKA|nr:hypothetical protein CKAH01_05687 [Colletotrichum kahawae]